MQSVALAAGGLYLLAGILGSFTVFGGSATLTSRSLFNLFSGNLVDNLVHVVIGIAGLAAASDTQNARAYCRIVAMALLLLGGLGIFVSRPFGLLDIGGADIALHLFTGAVLAYVGFRAPLAERFR